MDKSFRPKSGRFGIMPVVTTKEFGANPFTANSTVTVAIPAPAGKSFPLRAYVSSTTVGSDADGTLTVQLRRRKASDDSDVALTEAYNIEGLTTKERYEMAFAAVSDNNRIFLAADIAEVDLVSNSAAIDTQPTELTMVVEWAVLE